MVVSWLLLLLVIDGLGVCDDLVTPVAVRGVMVGIVEGFNSDVGVLREAVIECDGPMMVRVEASSLERKRPIPLV